MKYLRLIAFLVAVGGMAGGARAQTGLYGAPRLVRLPPTGEEATRSAEHSNPTAEWAMPMAPRPLTNTPADTPILVSVNEVASGPAFPQFAGSGSSTRVARADGPALKPVPDVRGNGPEPVPPSAPLEMPGEAAGAAPAKGPTPAPRSLVNQMLDEGGCSGTTYQPSGAFRSAVENPSLAGCEPGCEPLWYASAAGLILTRDRGNRVGTSFETGTPSVRLMDTQRADVDWTGGYEVRVGRRFGEGLWAVEGVYWRVDGLRGFGRQLPGDPAVATLSTPLTVDGIEFAGVNGSAFFNNAGEHKLSRRNAVDNVEVNLIRRQLADEEGLLQLNWSVGARYFRFSDDLTFGAAITGGGFGGDLTDEAFFRDRITNSLIGSQFGLDARYYLGYNLSLNAGSSIGLYSNHITNRFLAYRGDGLAANPTAISGFTGSYPVASSKDVLSFLGQVDVSLNWQFHPQWNAFVGYRYVAATGIGQADQQFGPNVADIPSLSVINHNGSLFLHGGFAGLGFRF